MNNYRAVRKYKEIKRNRRMINKLGAFLMLVGFIGILVMSGDRSILSLGQIVILGLVSLVFLGVGVCLINFVDRLEEDYPINLEMVEKGDRLCYTISNIK